VYGIDTDITYFIKKFAGLFIALIISPSAGDVNFLAFVTTLLMFTKTNLFVL
jgi:hypothetical protein